VANGSTKLDATGLSDFLALREEAVFTVRDRFYSETPKTYELFGERGREACREDIAFTIDFLRPALEFDVAQPFIDFVRWLRNVLETRAIPTTHVAMSLQWLEEFYQERLPRDAADTVSTVLRSARESMAEDGDPLASIDRRMPTAWEDSIRLQQALLAGDRRGGADLLRLHLERGASLLDVELHLVQPALYQIGRDWQANRISVAQEHLATSTATALLAQLAAELEPEAFLGGKILLACVESNEHAVGVRIVADGFEQSGWDVRCLGANVPTRPLVDEVERWGPNLVGLSVSMPHHLRSARETIAGIRARMTDPGPAVMLGGLAINSLPMVAESLGAQGESPDAEAALGMAERLLAERR